ncbi:MAG: protein kinase [Planctomycetota bacterium]|nr:protein kinase [Planctomycetota bacterium]
MDDKVTISFTGSRPGRPAASGDDATAFHLADGEADPGWTPLQAQAGGGPGQRYLIGRELGRGGMGVVYEGWDAHLQRSVAIKIMDRAQHARPGGLQRFFREARIASRLEHPGIITIHEFDVAPGDQAFIVMQLLSGQTLKRVLADTTDRTAALPALLAVFHDVCQAMANAHGAGVIHRDLKPSNIMVGPFGVVTVMDWGVAKMLDGEDDIVDDVDVTVPLMVATEETTQSQSTIAGTVFGTPSYLAPEQARGEVNRLDRRADVFGLGSILCEILTGTATFSAPDADARWKLAAAGATAAALERLDACGGPLPVVMLAKRCLAVDPDDRPADAREVVEVLTGYLESGQRRAEQELVRFFDLSVDLFCIAGLNGYFQRTNENLPRRLGFTTEELKAQRFVELVHPDDRQRTLVEIARLSRGELTSEFLNRFRCADGSYLWLEWNARAVPEEGVIYAAGRDVSDRVAAAELRQRLESERATLAAFAAAAGLFLTAPGSLRERLDDVVEEGIAQLGVIAMEVWQLDPADDRLLMLAAGGPEIEPEARRSGIAVGEGPVGGVAGDQQPRQVVAGSDGWHGFDGASMAGHGIGSFVGYPLLVGGRSVGVLAVYAAGPVSDLLVTAMTATVASVALAVAAGEIE